MVFTCSSYSMGVAMNATTISICLTMMCFMGMTAFFFRHFISLSKVNSRTNSNGKEETSC